MSTTFRFQKSPKMDFWTDVAIAKPKDEEGLYLVVQNSGGSNAIGFAWYRQDGDGNFAFTKNDVTHWAPAPKFPEEA